MKFVFGVLSLVNHAMCMQMSVHPAGDVELVEDGSLSFCDEECGTEFNLNGHTPAGNNLGGKGPLGGAEEIRFKNAATISCHTVDLVMKTTSEYTPGMTPNTGNGAKDGFGYVTLKAGTDVNIELTIVDSSTGAPVTVDDFTIWVYDLDMGKRGRGKESVTACGAAVTALGSKPDLGDKTVGDCTTFEALKKGGKNNNPTDRNALTEANKNQAIKATWSNANKANIRAAVGAGGDGRAFMFAATAKTVCPTTTTTTTPPYSTPKPVPVDPHTNCKDTNGGNNCSLDDVCKDGIEMAFFKYNIIHNNLGGLGPQFDHPPVLQYTKVAEHEGRQLDLIVSASSNYKDGNWNYQAYGATGRDFARKWNGVAGGGAGSVFTLAPLKFDLTFKIVWTDTQQPAVIPHWLMTYYDVDGNKETVGTCDAESVALFDQTAMQGPGCSGGCCTEKGAAAEYTLPSSWDSLSAYYKKPAVTFVFKNTAQGKFTYETNYFHRQFMFKGSKVLACATR